MAIAAPERLVKLADALCAGVHWGQVLLCEKRKQGDAACFALPPGGVGQAQDLAKVFDRLCARPTDQVVTWATGGTQAEVAADIGALLALPLPKAEALPLNVAHRYMHTRITGPEEFFRRAVANLLQLCIEVDRDGTQLQDLVRIYVALGIKQLSLPATEAEKRADGEKLAKETCACPFSMETDGEQWYAIMLKIENWVQKTSGQRDRTHLADELLREPEIEALVPKLKKLPPMRVAVVGHSMTMSLHWTTYGSWNDTACEIMKRLQPGFVNQGFHGGGMDASGAVRVHLTNLLAWKPTETWILVGVRTQLDIDALDKLVSSLRAIGSDVYIVDEVRPFIKDPQEFWNPIPELKTEKQLLAVQKAICAKYGGHVWEIVEKARQAPGMEKWEALDKIHMYTEGHLWYCRELLKVWAARAK